MIEKPNPFKVLKLPTNASNRDIVSTGLDLSELAETDEQRLMYREAIQELITNPSTRLLYELFEIPDARYSNPEWERFLKAHRKNPVDLSAVANKTPAPSLEDFNLANLINLLLDGLLTVQKIDLKVAVENSPFRTGGDTPPLEVRDVLFG